MGKIIGIIIGIVVIGVIIYFAVPSLHNNQTVVHPQQTNSVQSGQTQTPGGKLVTTCAHYETGSTGFKPNDASIIPSDVAAVGAGEMLCGSLSETNSVYYLTDKSDTQIEDMYKTKMLARGCTVAAVVTPAPGSEVYSLNISFACADGHYYVGTGFKDNGYWVTFSPPR